MGIYCSQTCFADMTVQGARNCNRALCAMRYSLIKQKGAGLKEKAAAFVLKFSPWVPRACTISGDQESKSFSNPRTGRTENIYTESRVGWRKVHGLKAVHLLSLQVEKSHKSLTSTIG